MTVPPEQAEVAAFLRSLAEADPVETHISLVFLGPDTVWKLKKAVRLKFLDFTSVDARQRFAERELELNARVAPGLYRDVAPVVRGPEGLAFGESGRCEAPIDWVLRMARVPAGDFLDVIAAKSRLTGPLLDATADAVADFHANLPASPGVDPVQAMRRIADGNVASALDAGLPEELVRTWHSAIRSALAGIESWQSRRVKDGFIRRAHGDLHLGNLCLWHGRPVPFDALEFDEAMATIDLAYDLAFLLMDLDRRGGRTAANRVMNRYVARTGDAELVAGLPSFLSIRAFIRAHVEAARGRRAEADAYLAAASAYLRSEPALVIGVGGLQGSGKSTLAAALAPLLGRTPGALHLRSDTIRKRRLGVAPEVRLPPSAYTEAESAAVFAELTACAREAARWGQAVIVDATFIDLGVRDALAGAARAAGVPFLGLWLDAPLAELERRVAARVGDASDATVGVLRSSARESPGPSGWTPVDATSQDAALASARDAVRRTLIAC